MYRVRRRRGELYRRSSYRIRSSQWRSWRDGSVAAHVPLLPTPPCRCRFLWFCMLHGGPSSSTRSGHHTRWVHTTSTLSCSSCPPPDVAAMDPAACGGQGSSSTCGDGDDDSGHLLRPRYSCPLNILVVESTVAVHSPASGGATFFLFRRVTSHTDVFIPTYATKVVIADGV